MEVVMLELPFPPSVNHYWCMFRGRVFVGKAGKEYRDLVYKNVLEQRCQKQFNDDQRLQIQIMVHQADKRRRDVDNMLKCLLDSLKHSLAIPDDWNFDLVHVERRFDSKENSISVLVSKYDKAITSA